MTRTTIMLPPSLQLAAKRRARELNISMGELIRNSLEQAIKGANRSADHNDSFLNDWSTYSGNVPKDGALKHDDHLYGKKR
jgi:hypothetical protein